MKTDIEIASQTQLRPIADVAAELGIERNEVKLYGDKMAKIKAVDGNRAKLILVTAINPTAGGEGKTTVSIGLADGLRKIGKRVCLALREPSLGPVFGMKGGAAGGGYAQIAPMDDINLHFTGDLHAITAANNLLAAMVDNHIYWGNAKKIKTVTFHRCLDMNDRALRNLQCGIGYNERADHFDITAASEVMAVLCLSRDAQDLKQRLGRIAVGTDEDGNRVTAADLNAHEAMAILLKDAVLPNLVQTLEGTPAVVHGGPFANIAHGCNSIIATRTAMHYADYVVTEAGFGADLGAEKFLDIKCRTADIAPDAVVLVATLRALKCAGGKTENLSQRDDLALNNGLPNLIKHLQNLTQIYSRRCVVAINRFATDEDAEIDLVASAVRKEGAEAVCTDCFARGGDGATDLASAVAARCNLTFVPLTYAYELTDSLQQKIEKIAQKVYGAAKVLFLPEAQQKLRILEQGTERNLPVCVAKTQYSLSDNPALTGRPEGFTLTVRDIAVRYGAGFVVALAGQILLMPGLSRVPNAENMHINGTEIKGLF